MANVIIPVAKKIFVCDDLVIDPESRKSSILNLWDTIRVSEGFPFTLGKLCVYAQLRGGLGKVPIHVEVARAGTGEVIRKSDVFVVFFPDRMTRYDVRIKLEDVEFPSPGTFVVEMYCNNVFLDDQPIRVVFDPA